ncbi:MAG TPA: transketolase, partial [Balneolaceae bacterium]|nr:transketolase [Balneolaceae bacterium]
ISIEGSTDLAFTEDVAKRFQAYGWHTIEIDGHDRDEVEKAITEAQTVADQPSLILCHTHIGYGSPNKQDSAAAHGAALGEEEVRKTKENLGWDPDKKFYIPDDVLTHFRKAKEEGAKAHNRWKDIYQTYTKKYGDLTKKFDAATNRRLPKNFEEILPVFDADEKGMATRASSGKVLKNLSREIPYMIGGSADLAGSTKTWMDGEGTFEAGNYSGRNFHFGVREHAMGAALNGMALHDGVIPFGASFLVFSDYCRPAIRIAALSHIPSVFVFTHDSVGLGEDGPTHQPIEHLASLRAMPNVLVLRPADANEVAWAWKTALEYTDGPSLLIFTRQSVPIFSRDATNAASNLEKGGYILSDSDKDLPDVILMGTGSEVQFAMEAKSKLADEGIDARVVSLPSWELFRKQDEAYRQKVLPKEVKARISIEAAATQGWSEWVGEEGTAIGIDHFGASAPYEELYERFGLTSDHVVEEAKKLL